jgi:hypothetical protein
MNIHDQEWKLKIETAHKLILKDEYLIYIIFSSEAQTYLSTIHRPRIVDAPSPLSESISSHQLALELRKHLCRKHQLTAPKHVRRNALGVQWHVKDVSRGNSAVTTDSHHVETVLVLGSVQIASMGPV